MKLSSIKVLRSILKTDTLEDSIKWIEEKTKILLRRQPYLKKALSVHNDIGNDLYSWEKEQITLASQSYIDALKNKELTSKSSLKSLTGYLTNLKSLTDTSQTISQIAFQYSDKRLESFKEKLSEILSDDEVDYAQSLVDILESDDKLKWGFVRSKFFLSNYDYPSEGMLVFEDTYGISLPVAKLELYLESKGIDTKSLYRGEKGYSDEFEVKSTRQKSSVYKNTKNYK